MGGYFYLTLRYVIFFQLVVDLVCCLQNTILLFVRVLGFDSVTFRQVDGIQISSPSKQSNNIHNKCMVLSSIHSVW